MIRYWLSPRALKDIAEIETYEIEHFGEDLALQTEANLFEAFERLALTPGLGHKRPDLTSRPYFIYSVDPYLVIYARQVDPLPILAIIHSARNVKKLLKSKLH